MIDENDIPGEVDASQAPEPSTHKVVTSLPVDHSGTTVYVKGWGPETSTLHPIILIHDLGEHVELYRETAMALVEQGYRVYGFDLRGHGRSGRRLGHAPSFKILVKDLLQVVAWVRHKEQGMRPILLGHGIGALIAVDFGRRYPNFCRAVILSAPCFELQVEMSAPARLVLKFLAEFFPTMRLRGLLKPRFAKEFRTTRESSGGSKPYFPHLTANFAFELLNAIRRTRDNFIAFPGDVLILCPELDEVCSYKNLKKLAAVHAEDNVRITDLPGVGHDLFGGDEATRAVVLREITQFLGILAQADGVPLPEPQTVEPDSPQEAIKRTGATRALEIEEVLVGDGDLIN